MNKWCRKISFTLVKAIKLLSFCFPLTILSCSTILFITSIVVWILIITRIHQHLARHKPERHILLDCGPSVVTNVQLIVTTHMRRPSAGGDTSFVFAAELSGHRCNIFQNSVPRVAELPVPSVVPHPQPDKTSTLQPQDGVVNDVGQRWTLARVQHVWHLHAVKGHRCPRSVLGAAQATHLMCGAIRRAHRTRESRCTDIKKKIEGKSQVNQAEKTGKRRSVVVKSKKKKKKRHASQTKVTEVGSSLFKLKSQRVMKRKNKSGTSRKFRKVKE